MDPNYNLNGFAGSSDVPPHNYSTPQNSSTSQRFPDQLQESNTLPPIGAIPNQPYPQPFYSHPGSMPQTPITPQTPIQQTSSAPPNPNAYTPMPPHTAPPRTLQPNPPHLPPVSSFSNAASLHTPPSTTIGQSAYYPTNTLGGRSLSDIRPRPDGTFPHLASQQTPLGKLEPEPTHVVGQQGRRGILPSAPGRAPPGSAKNIVPVKDADGKFPCPHCSKTYLHAKHLKRHMLRHTGDRPYMCKLCKDTFSRSDILKRHFQKCSIRRGAPADGDHLEGARVHQNKNRLSQSSVGDQSHYLNSIAAQPAGFDSSITNHLISSGMPNFMPGQPMPGQGMPGQNLPEQSAYNDNMASISNRTSRSSSLMQPANSLTENRRSLSSLEHLSSRTSYDGASDFAPGASLPGGIQGLPAYSMPTSVQSAGPHGNHAYGFSSQATSGDMSTNHAVTAGDAANGMFGRPNVSNGQGQEMNWNGAYPTSHPGYPMYQGGQVGGSNQGIKSETNLLNGISEAAESAQGSAQEGDVFSGLYSNSSTFTSIHLFDGWDIGDPFEHKAGALVSFCFPGATTQPTDDELKLREVLTPDNVRDFFKRYGNFQGHWPMIHMPTFNPIEAYDGLLLAMITIGAIYSDRLDLHAQRWLMEQAQKAVQRNSRVYNGQLQSAYAGLSSNHSDIEEIQALLALQIALTWHGNDAQRSASRENFFRLASVARQYGLLQPLSPEHPGFSILHFEGKRFYEDDSALWRWSTWVDQEKRLRTMFLIYLLDIALVLYFNCQPQFDWQEIKLPLPSDDAAWEARTGLECMDALGLNGAAAQEMRNITGSRRAKQIPFVFCVKALLHQTTDFQPRSTNVYSKFILIHALLTLIWTAQRQASSSVTATATFGNLSGSGPSTPISQSDWVCVDSAATLNNTASGRATPEMMGQHSAQHQQTVRQLTNAVEKWKRNWDRDMQLQYPATTTPGGTVTPPRAGFCRDGVHFYFLAMLFLSSNRAADSQFPADHRFKFVMNQLKAIRNYVKNDAYAHGKSIGSVVDIEDEYGVEDLTLDMKLLFAPLELNDTEGTATVRAQ